MVGAQKADPAAWSWVFHGSLKWALTTGKHEKSRLGSKLGAYHPPISGVGSLSQATLAPRTSGQRADPAVGLSVHPQVSETHRM